MVHPLRRPPGPTPEAPRLTPAQGLARLGLTHDPITVRDEPGCASWRWTPPVPTAGPGASPTWPRRWWTRWRPARDQRWWYLTTSSTTTPVPTHLPVGIARAEADPFLGRWPGSIRPRWSHVGPHPPASPPLPCPAVVTEVGSTKDYPGRGPKNHVRPRRRHPPGGAAGRRCGRAGLDRSQRGRRLRLLGPVVAGAPGRPLLHPSLARDGRFGAHQPGRWPRPCPRLGLRDVCGRVNRSPSARPSTAAGPTSRCSPRWPSGRAVPVRRRRRRDAGRADRDDAFVWHGYLPGCGRASGTATGSTARRTRPGAALQPGQAAAGPLRQGDRRARSHWDGPSFGYHIDDDAGDADTTGQRRLRAQVRRDQPVLRLGRRPAAARCRWHETSSTRPTCKGFTMTPPRRARGAPRHLRRPRPSAAVIAYLAELGVTAVELLPVHQFVHDRILVERGLRNYWGYNSSPSSPRTTRTPRAASGPAGAGVQGDGQDPPRGRHRGDPRRGLQPHRRGQPLGPTLSFRGIDNAAYYRLVPTTRASTWTTPGRGNSLNMRTRTCSS